MEDSGFEAFRSPSTWIKEIESQRLTDFLSLSYSLALSVFGKGGQ